MDGDSEWLWLVIVGFIIAFVLSFGIGANDVANSFGTSVGAKVLTIRQACILGTIFEVLGAVLVDTKHFVLSFGIGANDVANSFGTSVGAKVLTIRQACILGTIFEVLGAVLVGAKVSNTIRKGIVSPDVFTNGTEEMFLAGNVAALTGSCIWLMTATFFSLPVSGTHSIVGATLGFSLVINGTKGISWLKLGMIVASWFISPLISGIVSCLLFKLIDVFILKKDDPLKNGFRLLPIFYAVTMAVNLFSVFYEGSTLLHFDKIPQYGVFILTFGPAILVAIFVRVFIVPYQRRKIREVVLQEEDTSQGSHDGHDTNDNLDKEMTLQEALEHKIVVQNGKILHNMTDRPPKDGAPVANGDLQKVLIIIIDEGKDTEQTVDKASDSEGRKISSEHEKCITENSPGLEYKQVTEEESTATNVIPNKTKEQSIKDHIELKEISDEKSRSAARDKVHDTPETAQLFTFLQVLTAVFGSFAHGGNDVSNAIGPLVAVWVTYSTGSSAQSVPVPIWVLIYGGVGISVGLWVWGRRVMKTMGEDLTKITPSSGFCIEVGSALTVLVASNIGIPISTTHCKVGSVVTVGRVRSRGSVDWKLFRNIIFAWFVTLPVSGGLSALAMLAYRAILNAI